MTGCVNFDRLPRFFNHQADGKKVIFSQRGTRYEMRLTHESSSVDERIVTFRLLNELLQGQASEKTLDHLRESLKDVEEGITDLTLGRVREVYKTCILERLNPLQKLVASARLEENSRVVWLDAEPLLKAEVVSGENSKTVERFKSYLIGVYGVKKVEQVCTRYQIDLEKMRQASLPLTVDHIHQLMIGLNDIRVSDLESLLESIDSIIQAPTLKEAVQNLARQPQRVFAGFQRVLKPMGDDLKSITIDLITRLRDRFSTRNELKDLQSEQFNLLMEILKPARDTIYSGHKLEGVISSEKRSWNHIFVYNPSHDDQERLQLFDDIRNLHLTVPEDQIEVAFDELIAKALVKKEMEEGVIIPAPCGSGYYRVESRNIAGCGKLFYHLVPATSAFSLKERLEYRSTSSSPSTLDSLGSLITDAIPNEAPGSWSRDVAREREIEILTRGTAPIKINGHSLGGTFAMFALANLIEDVPPDQFPQRVIEVQYFDAPAIGRKDAMRFAQWVSEHPESAKLIKIFGRISGDDVVSGTGGVHLGYKVDKSFLGKYIFEVLYRTEVGRIYRPEVQKHPHGQQFYSTEADLDFTAIEQDVEAFDDAEWRGIAEGGRKAAGTYIAPLLLAAHAFKIAFVGSRTERSLIS